MANPELSEISVTARALQPSSPLASPSWEAQFCVWFILHQPETQAADHYFTPFPPAPKMAFLCEVTVEVERFLKSGL